MLCSSVSKKSEFTRRDALAGVLAAALWPMSARAKSAAEAPAEVRSELADAALIGEGRLRYFGLHIYDAALWGQGRAGELSIDTDAVGLELRYARSLKGALIAERSLKEMQGVGAVSDAQGPRWLQEMQRVFPDVDAGDRLTGIHRPGEGVRFFLNGKLRGEVRDAAFAKLFFSIWLSPRTSQPQLRLALLGKSADSAPPGPRS
jgi:hypothetical protein